MHSNKPLLLQIIYSLEFYNVETEGTSERFSQELQIYWNHSAFTFLTATMSKQHPRWTGVPHILDYIPHLQSISSFHSALLPPLPLWMFLITPCRTCSQNYCDQECKEAVQVHFLRPVLVNSDGRACLSCHLLPFSDLLLWGTCMNFPLDFQISVGRGWLQKLGLLWELASWWGTFKGYTEISFPSLCCFTTMMANKKVGENFWQL